MTFTACRSFLRDLKASTIFADGLLALWESERVGSGPPPPDGITVVDGSNVEMSWVRGGVTFIMVASGYTRLTWAEVQGGSLLSSGTGVVDAVAGLQRVLRKAMAG